VQFETIVRLNMMYICPCRFGAGQHLAVSVQGRSSAGLAGWVATSRHAAACNA
jgi:hypothetical protein